MVKKLLKYDFLSYMRKLLPVELILLGVALLTRIVMFFENDSVVYDLINNSSIFAYMVCMMVCMITAYTSVISRFYRNLFTGEGYLSFTLPVSPSQHLISKVISAICVLFITFLNVIVSFFIVTSGEMTVEFFKAVGYLFGKAYDYAGINVVFYAIELIITILFSSVSSIMLFYACICVGQLSKKNKVRAAFFAYFAFYFIAQIIETVLMVILTATTLYDKVMIKFSNDMVIGIHILFWVSMFTAIILCSIYYLVCNYIMKNKINLE